MNELFRAIQRGFTSLPYPQVWRRLLLPMALIMAFVNGIFIFFWSKHFSVLLNMFSGFL